MEEHKEALYQSVKTVAALFAQGGRAFFGETCPC